MKYHQFCEQSILTKANGKRSKVAYIVQELVTGGELYDYVANTGAFSAPIVRYYMRQLLSGVFHMHEKGFAHRDLKCANILLDCNYDIKLVDMGFARRVTGNDGTGWNHTLVGTVGHMAPQLHEGKPY